MQLDSRSGFIKNAMVPQDASERLLLLKHPTLFQNKHPRSLIDLLNLNMIFFKKRTLFISFNYVTSSFTPVTKFKSHFSELQTTDPKNRDKQKTSLASELASEWSRGQDSFTCLDVAEKKSESFYPSYIFCHLL